MIGTRLAHYEITIHLGTGGMGEVYQATDSKLGRSVAIKLLPTAFAQDAERVARFEREARVLASLNHRNIAGIYGVEESAGRKFLVMELVPGETLAERIHHAPIPMDETLAIAKQLAEGLESAHEKGIIHRDLKPANIKVTPDGQVKILDFGLAKAFDTESPNASASNSPTLSLAATQAGVIFGTAAYMSPEQARGKTVDKRADIWAFGVVVYEMLTGKRLFQGEMISDVLAAVIREEPNLTALEPRIRTLVGRCLKKDPRERLRDIGEARIALEDPSFKDATAIPAPANLRAHRTRRLVVGALAVLAVVGLSSAGFLAWVHFREVTPSPQTLRYHLSTPENTRLGNIEISPNGRLLAMASLSGPGPRISIQALDELEPKVLAGTEGASYPFWAPDSAHLGFFAEGKLKRIALAGGPATTLCDAGAGRGGTWSDAGDSGGIILFSPGPTSQIMRVSSAGGAARPVAPKPSGGKAENQRFPYFLPDGVHFFYSVGSEDGNTQGLWVGSLKGDASVRLVPGITQGRYAPPVESRGKGYLLFLHEQGTLMAQPFDAIKLDLVGEAVPVIEEVASGIHLGVGLFAGGGNGLLVYRERNAEAVRQLVWMDRTGKRLSEVTKPFSTPETPKLSPDEKTLALTIRKSGAGADLWLQQVGNDAAERFTAFPGNVRNPIFDPSGTRLAFAMRSPGQTTEDIYWKPVRGGKEELLYHGRINVLPTDWSPDGKYIVYSPGAFLLPVEGDRKPVPYLSPPATGTGGRFSPVGQWMAYTSNEGGSQQVWVQDIPATGKKFQISTVNGNNPVWRRDGKELYYMDGPDWMAAPMTLGETVRRGTPQRLFPRLNNNVIAASRDGQRFMVSVPASGTSEPSPITVVTNWQAAMRK